MSLEFAGGQLLAHAARRHAEAGRGLLHGHLFRVRCGPLFRAFLVHAAQYSAGSGPCVPRCGGRSALVPAAAGNSSRNRLAGRSSRHRRDC